MGFQSPVVLQKQLSVVYATFSMKSLNMENVECHFGANLYARRFLCPQIWALDLPFNALKIFPFIFIRQLVPSFHAQVRDNTRLNLRPLLILFPIISGLVC